MTNQRLWTNRKKGHKMAKCVFSWPAHFRYGHNFRNWQWATLQCIVTRISAATGFSAKITRFKTFASKLAVLLEMIYPFTLRNDDFTRKLFCKRDFHTTGTGKRLRKCDFQTSKQKKCSDSSFFQFNSSPVQEVGILSCSESCLQHNYELRILKNPVNIFD